MSWRLHGELPPAAAGGRRRGQLFVCNHRTLIDPVYVSVALDRPVRAVSYGLSRLSELISPIGRTVRLTRDRAGDGAAIARLLAAGDLVVVCPEGTTCREPYLLRFSPLFAELADDVVPVGVAIDTAMFYATTAGGLKCFDPLYYMVNPAREGKVASTDIANLVQRRMGEELGYSCTMLTRKAGRTSTSCWNKRLNAWSVLDPFSGLGWKPNDQMGSNQIGEAVWAGLV